MADEQGPPVLDIGLAGRKKVLVVEDEQNIASLIEDWLSDTFEVILASNGAAALQKAKWNKPDAMLMDIMMPDTGGYEVVCALQGDPVTAKIPVIVMTAKNFDDSTVKLIKAEPNVFGFLNKPFKPEEVKRQIGQVMAGQRTFSAPVGTRRPGAPAPAVPPPPPAPRPAAPRSAPPPLPPTPAFQIPAPPPVPRAAPAPLPPTPAFQMPAPPEEAPYGIVHGFPEIAPPPVEEAPSVPAGVPLPPFLRPSPMPAATPPPPPRPAPPSAPPPPRPASPPPPPPAPLPTAPVLEPTSAMPPSPEIEDHPSPVPVPIQSPESAPPPVLRDMPIPRAPRAAAPRPPSDDADEPSIPSPFVPIALAVGKWTLLLGVFAACVLGAAETGCRWTEKALDREIFLPVLRPSHVAELPYAFPSNESWTQGGVSYSISPWGVRDQDVPLIKPPNTFRIFVLGGTSLFGEFLPAEKTVAKRLEALLAEDGGRFRYEVINGGLWGYSPEEQWTFYEKNAAELKPDVLVWLCEEKAGGFPAADALRAAAQGGIYSLFNGSHLARLLTYRGLSKGAAPRKADFLSLLQPAAVFARQSDTKFLYAVLPARSLEQGEAAELPEKGRVDLDESVRAAFMSPRGASAAAHEAVAEEILAKVRALKPGGAGRKN